jgi:hypothetical protein
MFTLKNHSAFLPSKESAPHPQPQPQPLNQPPQHPLLSPILAAKARIWISNYSERLWRLDLQIQAAELDNIAASAAKPADSQRQEQHTGITAKPTAAKTTCSICYCKIQGLQQLCSLCLHTTHLECLRVFMDGVGEEGEMECPSGCGCVCSAAAYEETVWDDVGGVEASPAPAPVVLTQTMRRKWSFTDPRRWREQVQGDSW